MRFRMKVPHTEHHLDESRWIELVQDKPNSFAVIDNNIAIAEPSEVQQLGFESLEPWNALIQNLDEESEAWRHSKISQHLRVFDVEITPTSIQANSIKEIREALEKVRVCIWFPWDH